MILLFVILSFSLTEINDKLDTAVSLYKKGEYEKAIENYEYILREDIRNSSIYYNIGNCYFKNGALGKAILFYKRAKRLSPSDKDINFNLDFARSQRVDKIKEFEGPKFLENIVHLLQSLPLNILTIFTSIVYFLIFILLSLTFFFRKRIPIYVNIILLIIFVSSLGLFLINLRKVNISEGVVTTEVGEVRSGPEEGFSLIFTLHEGAEFRIIGEEEAWFKIMLPDGLIGWIKKESVEKV